MDVPDTVCLKQPFTGQRLCLPFCCYNPLCISATPYRSAPEREARYGSRFRRSLKRWGAENVPAAALSLKAWQRIQSVCSLTCKFLRPNILKDSLHAGALN